eukprot:3808647-Amphidinium_carterae.1
MDITSSRTCLISSLVIVSATSSDIGLGAVLLTILIPTRMSQGLFVIGLTTNNLPNSPLGANKPSFFLSTKTYSAHQRQAYPIAGMT